MLIGGNAAQYSNYNTLSQNSFPATATAVGFVDVANGAADYHLYALANTSAYNNAATDGSDIGVDMARLDSALVAGMSCPATVAIQPLPGVGHIRIQPNPFRGHCTLVSSVELNDAVLTLCNLSGQEVRRIAHISGKETVLSMGGLPAGVYFYFISTADKNIAGGVLIAE
ncbi:MAG: T9SS type A sorting domain-containing protein [Lewinellaceae bacterium]|nr:T9SS type A sorting domain-containing protein [Lewinellaceae bacterium]